MIKTLSLFSGIGAFEKALERQGIEHEVVAYCEIDKYASKSYAAIHNLPESMNLGDITKVDPNAIPEFDLMTWGFPCQDISVAGNLKGIVNGETRSGLYYEGFRILKAKMPKYSIIENVKNLVGKRFKSDFIQMLSDIEGLGYNNYWQVLNAKDYGIPQNRERVFIVSIRKDVDKGNFIFPEKEPLELRLKDMLEGEVDEKYYLSEKLIQGFLKHNERHRAKGTGFLWKPRDLEQHASALRANGALAPTDNTIEVNTIRLGGIFDGDTKHQASAIWDKEQISPTLDTMQGGYRQLCITEPSILTPKRTEYGKAIRKQYEAGEISESRHNMTEMMPREDGISNTLTSVQKDNYVVEPRCIQAGTLSDEKWDKRFEQNRRVYSPEGLSPTVHTYGGGGQETKVVVYNIVQNVKVRKNEIDLKKLKDLLRKSKNLSISEISNKLNKPKTLVEHWFRNDDSFAIPNSDIWFELKELLNIKTEEFDKQIMEFEIKENIYEKSNRVYDEKGISPTLTCVSANEKIINNLRIRKLTPLECWRLMGFDDADIEKAKAIGISNSQLYKQAGNSIVVNVLEKILQNLLKEGGNNGRLF